MAAPVVRRRAAGTNPRVGERGSDTHRRVLAAALEVFDEDGFADASVERIAERAGCSRPALYQYFSSKDDVLRALVGELGGELDALAGDLGEIGPDAAGVADLTAWVGAFMDVHERWAAVFRAPTLSSSPGQPSGGGPVGGTDPDDVTAGVARALLVAFGLRRTRRNERLVDVLVAVLVRSSFYAEAAPAGMSRTPLVAGTARFLHRVLAGPIDGVNLSRRQSGRLRLVPTTTPREIEPHRPMRPRGERTRRRLLDGGAAVLAERGLPDTRVDDLVRAAGVSHGTFYRYFDSTEDFFRVLATEAAIRMIGLVDELDLDGTPDELHAWVRRWFDAYDADGGIISTWQDMRTSPELAAIAQEVAVSVFTRLERLLEQRDFGHPQVSATLLLALIERAPYLVRDADPRGREESVSTVVTIVRRGFLAIPDE